MDQERAALRRILIASLLRVLIALSADDDLCAELLDLVNLHHRRDPRDKDARRPPQTLCGIRDRSAMISSRGRGDTRRAYATRQQVIEGAARFKRAGMLQILKLERRAELVSEERRGRSNIGREPRRCL